MMSPVAIDLGARHTGVFHACYEEDADWRDIREGATGTVYNLAVDSHRYTYMMASRTARRHQRRCHDRRQKAKRLFKLIWKQHLGLTWDKTVQQVVSFLLNRRGFTHLSETACDMDILSDMPPDAKLVLGEVLGLENVAEQDFGDLLEQWIAEGGGTVRDHYNKILGKTRHVGGRKVLVSLTKQLFKNGETLLGGNDKKKGQNRRSKRRSKLAGVNPWIIREWKEGGISGLPDPDGQTDIEEYLSQQAPGAIEKIINSQASRQYLQKIQEEEKEIKGSTWDFRFDTDSFDFDDFEKAKAEGDSQFRDIHIRHFAQALHQAESGGCHRSEYFKEIYKVLNSDNHEPKSDRNKSKGNKDKSNYLHDFCTQLRSGTFLIPLAGESVPLTPEMLKNLVGHISNLELKPLRKFFNNRAHSKSDRWLLSPDGKQGSKNKDFTSIYKRWVLSDWRVGEKDPYKQKGAAFDYEELRKALNSSKPNKTGFNLSDDATLIDFMLEVKPDWTIPPYQNNKNRHPPHCQSLVLNVKYLDANYHPWQQWVAALVKLDSVASHIRHGKGADQASGGGYAQDMLNIRSGKGKSYFDRNGGTGGKSLDARVLQFILDRVAAEDVDLCLNKIFGCAKRVFQDEAAKKDNARRHQEELCLAVENSQLPNKLKAGFDRQSGRFEPGSFLHLVYKYYRTRQKARQGRVFIHPIYRKVEGRGFEDAGRFYDKDHLLTYCNQKPRQKARQMLVDVADALQVSPDALRKHIGTGADNGKGQKDENKRVMEWLESMKGLEKLCERAASQQKSRRSRLEPGSRLVQDAVEMNLEIMNGLHDADNMALLQGRLDHHSVAAAFLLAKLHNIAFKDRGGYSRTCAVCSMDNALRMQQVSSVVSPGLTARSQRLPAISTRIIDGAVKRMAWHVSGRVANDIWSKIEQPLMEGTDIRVPIVIESNRFEFDSAANNVLKGRRDSEEHAHADADIYEEKRSRIRAAGGGICPYTDIELGTGDGDFDHIIPRTSPWGTLNDEANLIWASRDGNRAVKGEALEFPLSQLKDEYKQRIILEPYGLKNDADIEKWIVQTIGNGASEHFSFGKYSSFAMLTTEQQVAFRHALFLVGHPLRGRVIDAINHRNKTLVNGTQRYFAEVLANRLYKKALAVSREKKLAFDYYEIKARHDSIGDGISYLRRRYEDAGELDIQQYAKVSGEPQKPYSHLIDAQLAFVIAAHDHRNDGGMRIRIDDTLRKEPFDTSTGEVFEGMLNSLILPEGQCSEVDVRRRQPSEHYAAHRAFTRDSLYADHYIPILIKREGDKGEVIAKRGFEWEENSVTLDGDERKGLLSILHLFRGMGDLANGTTYASIDDLFAAMEKTSVFSRQLLSNGWAYLSIDKRKLHEYWIDGYNTKDGKSFNQFDGRKFVFKKLCYRTKKKRITKPEDIDDCLNSSSNFELGKADSGNPLTIWAKTEWESLQEAWQNSDGEDFDVFLRNYFLKDGKVHSHQKARKTFSLPVIVKDTKFLIRRKSWNGQHIYQVINDADHQKGHNSPLVPVRAEDGSIGKRLAQWARSENIVKFSADGISEGDDIDPNKWWKVVPDKKSVRLPEGIAAIWYQIGNITSPTIAVKLGENGSQLKTKPFTDADGNQVQRLSFMDEKICQHADNKSRADTEGRVRAGRKGGIVKYKGGDIISSRVFKNAFQTAKVVDNPE